MNAQELEKQVQALPKAELARFGKWFETYLEQVVAEDSGPDEAPENLSGEQKSELLRRVEFAKAHPEALEAWGGTTDRIRRRLYALRAQEAAASRS